MFSILPLNFGDAFCFICLPNLTDVATNDDRTTEATRERVFVFFCFSVVVPPAKGLELLRFVVEVYLKFFLRRVHFVHCNGCWAQSIAQKRFAVFTRFIFLFVVVFVLHRTIRNLRFHHDHLDTAS